VILLIGVELGRLYGLNNGCKPVPAGVRRNGGAFRVECHDETESVSRVVVDTPVVQQGRS
jgi:hypothetical protein